MILSLILQAAIAASALAQTWTSLTNLPRSRFRHVAAGVDLNNGDRKIFVFGGVVFNLQHRAVDAYNPNSNPPAWDPPNTYPDMPTSREYAAVAVDSSDRIYVIGGRGPNMTTLASIDVFDPNVSGGTWSTIPNMSTPRMSAGATFGPDGNLYVTGGTNASGGHRYDVIERFDGSQWHTLNPLPMVLPGVGGLTVGAAVGCNGNIIVVSNSWPGGGSCTGYTFEYDIDQNQWITKAPMPGCLGGRGVVRGPNQAIYAVNDGNYFQFSPGDTRVYSYNSCTDSWTAENDTLVGHNDLAVAALGDRIYALGGSSKFGANPGVRFESLTTGTSPICNYWQFVPGAAKDIGVGADGTAWKIGTDPRGPSDYNISRYDNGIWVDIPGGAVRIDVDPNGDPWVVNSNGNIYKYNYSAGGGWQYISGSATDIGISANGDVWKIGTDINHYGGSISWWDNGTWVPISGRALRIDADPQGNPWVVNAYGNVYKYTKSQYSWRYIPGKATDIGAGSDGSVWRTGGPPGNNYGFEISKWDGGNGWHPPIGGMAEEISVGPNGKPWVVNLLDSLYRRF